MKITLIQMNSVSDKAANLAAASALIEQAVREERPDWICLPEVFDFIGGARADKAAAAEALPGGPAYSLCSELARRHGVFIHAGSILEKAPGEERLHNTTVAFDRCGEEVARYRKIHMFDITAPDGAQYRESAAFKPGDAVVTYDCDGLTIGCAICYDLRFPYLFQKLAEKGADMIALPSAFTMVTGKDHWEVLLRARAIESQTYLVAPDQTGAHKAGHETRVSYGHSLVADPWGHVVARASDGVGLVSTRIEPERIRKVRAMIPVASHKVALPA
ncbi:carbon-nitrogen hydrolase family protein [Methylosinus sp. Sm6]|uniref:carbon-nitrogen hydrolase family protein n=1 Tax=Methylosinus sp. Sm6 TaxID=2866948 RepID=UPI001C99F117|nr:carbon-nitrogen hydrolase family protein [Methylosinus sp. Sm6]MBY6243393.1 carbon-nitrogen hydrolase family protein [Methylosinus sp. Sm6]